MKNNKTLLLANRGQFYILRFYYVENTDFIAHMLKIHLKFVHVKALTLTQILQANRATSPKNTFMTKTCNSAT